MNRLLIIFLLALGVMGSLQAQELDSLRRDTIPKKVDSLAIDTAGARATETRRERRQRERLEREAQEEKQTIFKDSARLALEAMSVRPWKQSLKVPGWGQITNGGWWWLKVPVIYGGFVSAVLVFEFNNRYYRTYRSEAQYRLNNNHAIPPNTNFPYLEAGSQATDRLIAGMDYYRRSRDLTILVTVGWWGIQAVEAYVTSMLKHRWDISDDLGINISPTLLQQPATSLAYQNRPYAIGFKVGFRF
ncbi:DUF5683 domain-containing protein [Parapedobacter koreensis]|uniref:DUF5683 domain-containing protein n=1 Tax=Parapedobacter koreensis TaxID=332977 RepID=A0A1H7G172_9SPHI|nr:DUF5683 domain-containing protein [Parapedobacter koreensis]SEK31804.1 hypothetical protein SAMN05421740_101528 [Parapedobacter koreensis]